MDGGSHDVLKQNFVKFDASIKETEMKAAIIDPIGWTVTIKRTVNMKFVENILPMIRSFYYIGYYRRTIKYETTRDDGSTSNFLVEQLIGLRYR